MSLVIYTKPGCPYCDKARDYYNEKGVEFVEYDAQNDPRRKREMLEFSGGDPVVPCIVENGVYIGSGWGDPPRG
jgi:glutaredoxin